MTPRVRIQRESLNGYQVASIGKGRNNLELHQNTVAYGDFYPIIQAFRWEYRLTEEKTAHEFLDYRGMNVQVTAGNALRHAVICSKL